MTDLFEVPLPTEIVQGCGAVERLGELARGLGAKRVLIVTDLGLVHAGHAERARVALESAGRAVRIHDSVGENPTEADAEAVCASAQAFEPELLIGLGGGSSIDAAKAGALLLAGGGRVEDYWGVGKARGTLLPLVAVPTTAGTGSEVQSFALISRAADHAKMACGDPQLAPRFALLDPELTLSLPPLVTACTGLDALGHAVESMVTRSHGPESERYALESFRLAEGAFERVLATPADLDARGDMLLAASWAGVAIEHSMLGAAHSMANPLTAEFDVPHGLAVAIGLPHAVRYNAQEPAAAAGYARLAEVAGLEIAGCLGPQAAEVLAQRLEVLIAATGLESRLSRLGVERGSLARLAEGAAAQWTAQHNPRLVDAAALEQLYAAAFD